jgi:hypothetical protein
MNAIKRGTLFIAYWNVGGLRLEDSSPKITDP